MFDYFEDLKLGHKYSGPMVAVTDLQIQLFGHLTGDRAPVHLSQAYIEEFTDFKKPVAQACLISALASGSFFSMLSCSAKMQKFAMHLGESYRFRKPVFVGDAIATEVELIELTPKAKFGLTRWQYTTKNQRGELVMEGDAVFGFPFRPKEA